MIARRTYRPATLPGVTLTDDGGPARCIGPAAGLPVGWYRLRSLRTGHVTVGHASRFVPCETRAFRKSDMAQK